MGNLSRSGCVFLGAWLAVVSDRLLVRLSSPGTENAAGAGGTSMTTTPEGGSSQAGNTVVSGDSAVSTETGSPANDAAVVTPPVDAATLGDVVVAPGDASGMRSKKDYLCNIVIGTSVVYDWFTSGFENGVDGSRWEGLASPQAGMSFIQMWNDANSALWTMAKLSPCTEHATTPDRAIFQGVNWEYTTAAQWVTQLDAAVKTLQAKFPGIKEIDLMTMLRAPNNMSCGSTETVVQPFIDEAIATVAAKYPGLVEIAPKILCAKLQRLHWRWPALHRCGKMTIAKVYSDYYAKEP